MFVRSLRGGVLCCAFLAIFPLSALPAQVAVVTGAVVDQATGLALSDAIVTTVPRAASARTDPAGHFTLTLPAGRYVIEAQHTGYQPGSTQPLGLHAGLRFDVTIALERATNDLSVIAQTTVRASSTLRKSGTFYRTLEAEPLLREGTVRAADALRTLPGVNNGITGDTGNFADDVNVSIRGLGTLETQATLDGHPIGFGFPGGYNYNLSPLFAMRNVDVTYGSSGQALSGVDAIGGVIGFQTLDPTPQRQISVMQGIGSFRNLITALRATGTVKRFGYAAAYGVSHIDGPIENEYRYQPGAAFDQSSDLPSIRRLGVYKDDSTAVSRSGLAKAVYAITPRTHVSFTALASSMWDDKTGNGDGDYLDYSPAFMFGQHLLAIKAPNDPCSTGTFTATNANGSLNGTGPNGEPDGASAAKHRDNGPRLTRGIKGRDLRGNRSIYKTSICISPLRARHQRFRSMRTRRVSRRPSIARGNCRSIAFREIVQCGATGRLSKAVPRSATISTCARAISA